MERRNRRKKRHKNEGKRKEVEKINKEWKIMISRKTESKPKRRDRLTDSKREASCVAPGLVGSPHQPLSTVHQDQSPISRASTVRLRQSLTRRVPSQLIHLGAPQTVVHLPFLNTWQIVLTLRSTIYCEAFRSVCAHLSGLAKKPVHLSCHSAVKEFCDGAHLPSVHARFPLDPIYFGAST
jgi:hypothetical protein